MRKKALVLGAGASLAYGFPLGGTLREKILTMSETGAKHAGIIRQAREYDDLVLFQNFRKAFERSQLYSIDAFLGRRREYSEIGKLCIASILLQCEKERLLFTEGTDKDHWYQYLFNQFATRDWDELDFGDISIVTFNYDRSLEHFLYVALQNTYAKNGNEAREKLKSLRIVHVYGCVSDELPGSRNYIEYGGPIDMGKVHDAARGLVVIPEGRSDGGSLKTARAWLAEADVIGFLGFGFDPTNVERLAEDEACALTVQRPHTMVARGFCGTRIGIYEKEMEKALRKLTGVKRPALGSFVELNCTQMLRSSQMLGA